MSKLTTFLFLDRFARFLTQSSLRCEFRKNIIKQIIKTAVQIFSSSNTLSKFKEGSGRAGRVTLTIATRFGQHNNTNSATEIIDSSTGSADTRGAVWQASTTERMTDTTMNSRRLSSTVHNYTLIRVRPLLRSRPAILLLYLSRSSHSPRG